MKLFSIVLLVSMSVMATDFESIYLQKSERSGHVLPEHSKSVECTVYFNGIVTFTTYNYTGLVKKVVNNYGIKKESRIDKIIEATFDGDQVREVYPADANSVKYVAGFKNMKDMRVVNLLDASGDTGVKTVNNSLQAKRLIALIDDLCK